MSNRLNLTKKNRFIFAITSLNYGGAQKNFYYLLKAIKEYKEYNCNFEPVVVSLKKEGRYKNKLSLLNVKVYDLGFPEKFSLSSLHVLLFGVVKFFYLIMRYKPQGIHSFLFQANFLSRFAKILLPRIKIICSERVAEREKPWQLKLLKWTDLLVDVILVNSEDLKNFVLRTQNVSPEKVVVVENIIDVEEIKINNDKFYIRKQLGINEEDFFVLSIGRLHKMKGFDLLIEVVKDFSERAKNLCCSRKYIFAVIGDGEEHRNLVEYAAKLQVKEYIKFLGYKENVYDYINACDLFLLTSYWEGAPNVVLEAAALKKAILSTNAEGVRDVVDDNFVISLQQPRENIIREFSNKIMDIYLKRKNYTSEKFLSKKFSIDKYSPKNVVGKVLNYYN
jgi:glycosyltransferase involved in cell wall biosynthesis